VVQHVLIRTPTQLTPTEKDMTHADLTPSANRGTQHVERDMIAHEDGVPRNTGTIAWTRSALRDVIYSAAGFAWSIAAFTILVTGIAVTASLLFLLVGVFAWIGFAHILHWTTFVDRKLAGWQRHERVPAVYRRSAARGFMPYLTTLSSDPQTWRDMAWLGLTSIIGFAGGLAVITTFGLATAYLSMPLWYWTVPHPQKGYGITNLGVLTVDTLGEAVITAAIGLLLIPLLLLLAHWWATSHAGLAVRMLASVDSSRSHS
jgi:Putative sensor